ncbi:hypothetical protein RNQ87_05765, partial [Escherichia coli]|nr:hypothetical protein [Escherichia coli]
PRPDTACGLQAEKTGRFSLHWRDNTRPDKHRASGKLTFVISINHRVTGGDGFLTSYRQKCIRH